MKLSQSQIDKFHEDGYLQLDDALALADINPVIWEFEGLIDRRARELYAKGRLTNLHECEPFDRRIAYLAAESDSIAGELSPSQTRGAAMFYLMRNPTILDILESLIGPEILCHPTHVVRPRMRNNFNTTESWRTTDQVPWHQDAGVLRPEADNSLLITVWIPLSEANEENGCLMVIPGSHKYGVRCHQPTNTYKIPAEELPPGEPKMLPIKPGGLILFSNLVCHSSLPHASDRVRWSIDLRYQDPSKPTGHPYFSGFIVRSCKEPESELRYPEWVSLWEKQLIHSAPWPPIPRWSGSS